MSRTNSKYLLTFFSLMLFAMLAAAQPQQKLINVQVTPTDTDWAYQLGENTDFDVKILKNGQPVPNIKIRYEIGLERMPATKMTEKLLKNGRAILKAGWYSWGFNDNICPPTSMYAAYNVITAPKELHKFLETAHWTYPEQWEDATRWLLKNLKSKD